MYFLRCFISCCASAISIYISELSRLVLACDEVSELVQYLHTRETTDYTSFFSKLPACMSGLVSNIILGKTF